MTIIVGTYISGVIQELSRDYNTKVKRGQTCAKIDPRPYQSIVDQAKASLAIAKAQLEKDKASLTHAKASAPSIPHESISANYEARQTRFAKSDVPPIVSQVRLAVPAEDLARKPGKFRDWELAFRVQSALAVQLRLPSSRFLWRTQNGGAMPKKRAFGQS